MLNLMIVEINSHMVDDVVFEVDLLKSQEINLDYIVGPAKSLKPA